MSMARVVKAIRGKRVIPVEAVAVWGPCPTRAGYFPGLRAYLDSLVQHCRVCGCTDEYGCDEGCSWVEEDLCSSCVGKEAK